jgi:flagellar biosynthesis GTPase FlhF
MDEVKTIPQLEKVEREAKAVMALVSAPVVVNNVNDYREADEGFAAVKAMRKENEKTRTDIANPIYQAWKNVNARFKVIDDDLAAVEKFYSGPMTAWQREQDKIRAKAEADAAAAKKKLEDDARALAKIEEDKLLAAQKVLDDAKTSGDAFAELMAEEEVETAKEATLQAIRDTHNIVVESSAPAQATAAGSRVNRPWKFRVTDPTLVPREYLMIDESKLGQLARTMKKDASVPGVEFFEDITIGGR